MADLRLLPLHGLWDVSGALSDAPPGSMALADNICFRKHGALEPLPQITKILTDPFTGGYKPRRIFDGGPGTQDFFVLAIAQVADTNVWETRWLNLSPGVESAGASITLYGAAPTYERGILREVEVFRGDRAFKYLVSRSNLIWFDSSTPTVCHAVGLSAPCNLKIRTPITTDGRAIRNNTAVNYRAVFRRSFTGNREQTGPPTNLLYCENTTGSTVNYDLTFGWVTGLQDIEVVSGTSLKLRVYRTKSVPVGQEPGDRMYFVAEVSITAPEIAARQAAIIDRITDDELGEELYTNTGQEGLVASHYMPPHLIDVCEYNGSLYGISTYERHSLSLYIGVPMGLLTTDVERANGLGERPVTGTTTLANPVITAISASNMKGLAVGQRVISSRFVAGTTIIAVGALQITCSTNATLGGAGHLFATIDQMEINGTVYDVSDPDYMMAVWQASSTFTLEAIWQLKVGEVSVQSGQSLTLAQPKAGNSLTNAQFGVRATNGDRYQPRLDGMTGTLTNSSNDHKKNRIAWSAPSQPDSWPIGNRETLGEAELQRLVATAEAMFLFATSGRVYRVSGQDSDLVSDVIMEETYLAGPNAVVAWGGAVYAWTNRGLLLIGDGGIENLSTPIQRSLLESYNESVLATLVTGGDLFNFDALLEIEGFYNELWLRPTEDSGGGNALIFGLTSGEWTNLAQKTYAHRYSHDLRTMVEFQDDAEASLSLYKFGDITSTAKFSGPQFRLNRLDAGDPGTLKQWREFVLMYQLCSTNAALTPDITTSVDMAAGTSASATSNESTQLNSDNPTPHTVHISANTGLSMQFWLEYIQATGNAEWALDGIVLRYEPQVDRSGSRST